MFKKPTYEEMKNRINELEKNNTQLKQAVKMLLESEQKFRLLAEKSLTGIFIHQNGKFVFVNDRFAEIHGYIPGELLGKEYLKLIHPNEREEIKKRVSERLNGKDIKQRYEIRRLGKDGSSIWCEMMVARTKYRGKAAIMGNIVDITKRKRAEEALSASKEKLNSIIRSIPDIIYRLDPRGRINFVNDSINQYGYNPKKLVDKNILEIVHYEDRKRATYRINERRTKNRSTRSCEIRLLVGNQDACDSKVFSISAEGLYSSEKPTTATFLGTQGIARDITDRMQAQNELLQREKIQGVLEIAGAVCHEMNQPMMAIMGYSELALTNLSDDDLVYDKISKIKDQIDRMGEITKKLMGITRYKVKDYAGVGKIIDIDKSSDPKSASISITKL